MKAVPTHPILWKAIKFTSSILISMALGLIFWQFYALANQDSLPQGLDIFVWLAGMALLIHSIEGVVAATIAWRRGDNVLKSGIYTFFTGIAGLSETFNHASGDADGALRYR
jgi:hypothetical protein